jgi:16S rRNA (guanine(966)-N(2))-methyltransferase RsmD
VTRIVAGSRRGRRIAAPSGQDTRPTSDRVREALFSALDARVDLAGCRFLDLYAGSGAVGLEAASRGAASVRLVESDPRAARTIRANIDTLDLGGSCRLIVARVGSMLGQPPPETYDVVFADPPYAIGDDEVGGMLSALVTCGWLADDAVVVVERSTRSAEPAWPEGLAVEGGRRYGETTLWFARSVIRSPRGEREQEGGQ